MTKWHGNHELVIGEVNRQGQIIAEYRIQPGETIPPGALELLRKADKQGGAKKIEYGEAGQDDRALVTEAKELSLIYKYLPEKQRASNETYGVHR